MQSLPGFVCVQARKMCTSEVISLWNISFKSSVNHGKFCRCSLTQRPQIIMEVGVLQYPSIRVETIFELSQHLPCWHRLVGGPGAPCPVNEHKDVLRPTWMHSGLQTPQNSTLIKQTQNLTPLRRKLKVESGFGSCTILSGVWFLFCLISCLGSLCVTMEGVKPAKESTILLCTQRKGMTSL